MADAREVALGLLHSLGELRERCLPRLELHPRASLCSVLGGDYARAWAIVTDLEDALGELGVEMPPAVALCDPVARGAGAELASAADMIAAAGAMEELASRLNSMKDENGRSG